MVIPAAFTVYNSMLLYGFVNYIWGVAMFLIAASAWLAFEKKSGFASGVWATAIATATYFAHLSGCFFLCVFIAIFTAMDLRRVRQLKFRHLLAFVPVVPSLICYALLGSRKGDISVVGWPPLRRKLIHLGAVFSSYSRLMDAITVLGLLAAVLLAIRYGRMRMDRRALAVVFGFLLCFCVFPDQFHTSNDADTRFLLPFALTGILALSLRLPRKPAQALVTVVSVVMIARLGMMTDYWLRTDRISMEQLGLLDKLDRGAVLYPMVFLPTDRTESKIRQHLVHFGGYATVDTNAISGSTFAYPGQQVLRRRIPLWFHFTETDTRLEEIDWHSVWQEYTNVWIYNAPPPFQDFLDHHAELKATAGQGRLYLIRH